MLNITSHLGKANQNHNESPLQSPTTVTIIKCVGEDVEKLEPSLPTGGNVHGYRSDVKQFGRSSINKLKIELPWDSAIPFPGIYPKDLKADVQTQTYAQTYTQIFISVLFTLTKRWK